MSASDYIFVLKAMNGHDGSYENVKVTAEESEVADFFISSDKMNMVANVDVFSLGTFGIVRTIYSLKEFEEFN